MTAISLREAAKQLRDVARRFCLFAESAKDTQPTRAKLWTRMADDREALATLLDGDGEGGLLALHPNDAGECSTCAQDVGWDDYGNTVLVGVSWPCPTLTLVAAYVSAVLGVEVTA